MLPHFIGNELVNTGSIQAAGHQHQHDPIQGDPFMRPVLPVGWQLPYGIGYTQQADNGNNIMHDAANINKPAIVRKPPVQESDALCKISIYMSEGIKEKMGSGADKNTEQDIFPMTLKTVSPIEMFVPNEFFFEAAVEGD
jgi:hypothetical protein